MCIHYCDLRSIQFAYHKAYKDQRRHEGLVSLHIQTCSLYKQQQFDARLLYGFLGYFLTSKLWGALEKKCSVFSTLHAIIQTQQAVIKHSKMPNDS